MARNFAEVEKFNDPYTIAGVIKKICDKMPVPVVPYSAYAVLMEYMKNKEPREHVHFLKEFVKNELPELNCRLFSFLVSFLKRVSEVQEANKMTEYNLAVVFGPTFVRPKSYSMEHLKE